MSASVTPPIQGATVTVTLAGHPYANGDYVHFSGAQGAGTSSISELNSSSVNKATCGPITVIDANSFRCTRFSTTLPTYGALTLTQQPLMRRTTNTSEGFYLTQKLRGRGVACLVTGSP
jgi:hypothetical protein